MRKNGMKRPWHITWVVIGVPMLHLAVAWAFFSSGDGAAAVGRRADTTSPAAVPVAMGAMGGATATPAATNTDTPVADATYTDTPTPTDTPTDTPGEPSPQPTAVPTLCVPSFSDVQASDWFYGPVRWMACNGFASGYADHTFRPGNNATRGQIAKIVVLASRWSLREPQTPTFGDVPPGSAFYDYVETGAAHGIVSGYADGTFRPGNNVTRGQLCKIVVLARAWPLVTPTAPTFSDVLPNSAFFVYVETAVRRGIISGYAGGTFMPGNLATRAQLSKIVHAGFVNP